MSPRTIKFPSLSQKVSLRISRYKTDKNSSRFRCSPPGASCWVCVGRERYRGIPGAPREEEHGGVEISQWSGVERANEALLVQCRAGVPYRSHAGAGQSEVTGRQGKEEEKP